MAYEDCYLVVIFTNNPMIAAARMMTGSGIFLNFTNIRTTAIAMATEIKSLN